MGKTKKQAYKLENGVLHVFKDLRQDVDHSFDQACSDLLNSPEVDLEINLQQVSYINSTYIGMIAATFFQAQALGKHLAVRGQAKTLQVLRAAGFDGFIKLKQA